ncbi:MAG: hypothetical protein WC752_04560 [Patescibacteria group bacterium]|jgi:hypothetical protein
MNPIETERASLYERIIKAHDYSELYFSERTEPKEYAKDAFTLIDDIPDENLHLTDEAVFSTFQPAQDNKGRIWLLRGIEDIKKEKPDLLQRRAFAYELGRTLGVNIVETRLVEIGEVQYNATRFLPNAVDRSCKHFPPDFRAKVEQDLSVAWPFNYFMQAEGDLQYIFTSAGRGVLIDYAVGLLLETESMPPLPENQRWSAPYYANVRTQSKNLDRYRDYLDGVHQTDALAVQDGIRKIMALSDSTLEELVRRNLPQTLVMENGEVADYQKKALAHIKWRRDHIQEVFGK